MQKETKSIPVKIVSVLTEKATAGTVELQRWTKKEQTQRALKYGGICWGLALAAVPLPLVHFILVPILLIAGPVVAFYFLKQEGVILSGSGICPDCGQSMTITRASSQFPLSEVCSHCRRTVKVIE